MNIIIIGSGHVASVLGKRMVGAGHAVCYVAGRNPVHAERLATTLRAKPIGPDFKEWPRGCEIVLVAVSDDAYPGLAATLPPTEMFILHSGGAVPGNIFQPLSESTGVLYPLQSIRAETDHSPVLPLLIDSTRKADFPYLNNFALTLSPLVTQAGDETRLEYHLAAVFTANFANHLFALTETFCRKRGLDFAFLQPLLEETVLRLRWGSAVGLQTGPALRGDKSTIEKHLLLLKNEPAMNGIYTLLSKSIMDFYS